ncbi:MAG: hypothetical protein U0T81_10250 [Saprospiraceae bacterium]
MDRCVVYQLWAYAYSNIYSSYQDVPTYSWTIEVMTYEMGHNIGSNHTHWCGWTGGAIDNCYTPEAKLFSWAGTYQWGNHYVILPFDELAHQLQQWFWPFARR